MKKRRNGTKDQSEEEADGKSRMLLQKKGQQIGHAKKADPVSEKNRKQNWKMQNFWKQNKSKKVIDKERQVLHMFDLSFF